MPSLRTLAVQTPGRNLGEPSARIKHVSSAFPKPKLHGTLVFYEQGNTDFMELHKGWFCITAPKTMTRMFVLDKVLRILPSLPITAG